MAIYTNGGTRITDVKVSSGTKINYVYDATNKKYVWARIVEIIFKMPWQMFSSWSIVRTSTREPSASLDTAVASNSLNSGLANGGEVKISGYCGDTYKLTRTVITGYSGLVENGKTYSVGESDATFEETSGAAIQLSKPTVSVTREGADVKATITNNNSYECHLYALCSESEYAVVDENWIGVESTTYEHGHLYYTSELKTKTGIKPGKTFVATWTTNNSGYDCTYAVVKVWFGPADDTAFKQSETVTVTSGTEHVDNTSGGGSSSGSSFTGFGGTLQS